MRRHRILSLFADSTRIFEYKVELARVRIVLNLKQVVIVFFEYWLLKQSRHIAIRITPAISHLRLRSFLFGGNFGRFFDFFRRRLYW